MAQEVAALSVRLEASAARFEREMQRATRTMNRQAGRMERRADTLDRRLSSVGARFGKQLIAGLGAFAGVQGFRSLFRSFDQTVDRLDAIAKQADKLGVTSEALQEMRFAAEQSGVAVNTFDTALQRFTRRTAEAANGTGEAQDALEELGITLRDNEGRLRPTEALLEDVADALAEVEDQGERVRLGFKLFDSEGAAVINMLQRGSDELERMRQEARDLGIVLSEDVVRDAEHMRGELDKIFAAVGRSWDRLLVETAQGWNQLLGFIPKTIDEQFNEVSARIGEVNREIGRLEREPEGRGPGTFGGARGLGEKRAAAAQERIAALKAEREELREQQSALQDLRAAREAAGKAPPVVPGGGSGAGGAAERGKDFEDLLDLIEREINALDREAATIGLNDAERAKFLATLRAEQFLREEGIQLTEKQRKLLRVWLADVATAAQRLEEKRAAHEADNEAMRESTRAAEEARRGVEQIGQSFLSAVRSADSFEDALKRVAFALANLAIQGLQQPGGGILGSLFPSLLGGGGASFPQTLAGANIGSLTFAKGAAFDRGAVTRFAHGGVVQRPTVFPMADGMGLMGESGPEAVMPLKRGPGGRLGIESSGSGGPGPFFIDARGADQAAIARLERVITDLAGPGKTERRAVNAVSSAQHRGHRLGPRG